jgi:hypothetical protein
VIGLSSQGFAAVSRAGIVPGSFYHRITKRITQGWGSGERMHAENLKINWGLMFRESTAAECRIPSPERPREKVLLAADREGRHREALQG